MAPETSANGLQEPGIVELRDGRLMMWHRTDMGSQLLSYSEDGGDTWTDPVPSNIISPLSPAAIKRLPQTGDLILVWNDHSNIDERRRGKRTPLAVAISKDEGKTWINTKFIEEDAGIGCWADGEGSRIHVKSDLTPLATRSLSEALGEILKEACRIAKSLPLLR